MKILPQTHKKLAPTLIVSTKQGKVAYIVDKPIPDSYGSLICGFEIDCDNVVTIEFWLPSDTYETIQRNVVSSFEYVGRGTQRLVTSIGVGFVQVYSYIDATSHWLEFIVDEGLLKGVYVNELDVFVVERLQTNIPEIDWDFTDNLRAEFLQPKTTWGRLFEKFRKRFGYSMDDLMFKLDFGPANVGRNMEGEVVPFDVIYM